MSAASLLKTSQKFYVDSGLGDSIEVIYINQDEEQTTLNAFIEYVTDNDIKADKSLSKCILTNVQLPSKPKQNDIVKIDNENFRVMEWDKDGDLYILYVQGKRYKV